MSRSYILFNSSEVEPNNGVYTFPLNNILSQVAGRTRAFRMISGTVSHTWENLDSSIPFRFSEDNGTTWEEVFLNGSPSTSQLTTTLKNKLKTIDYEK